MLIKVLYTRYSRWDEDFHNDDVVDVNLCAFDNNRTVVNRIGHAGGIMNGIDYKAFIDNFMVNRIKGAIIL